jgi:hypothetical protein
MTLTTEALQAVLAVADTSHPMPSSQTSTLLAYLELLYGHVRGALRLDNRL